MEVLNIHGFKVCLMPDPKLKTAAVTVYINVPLKKETAALHAVWPAVLMRGCEKYPETKNLNIYMEQLFGATSGFRVEKQGAQQRISLKFKTVADDFAEDEPFTELIRLAGEILFHPLIEDDGFRPGYTEREKEVQVQYIEGIVNDKRKYASMRLIEEMCAGEEYSIPACGDIESVRAIDRKALLYSYKAALAEGDISIYVTDHFDKEKAIPVLKEILKDRKAASAQKLLPQVKAAPGKVRYAEEKAPVTQGKLSIGFRTDITRTDERYYAMTVFNKLFGGAPYSKLFCNVREKLSLAYYASSAYNSLKGLILVNSGIEFANFAAARDEILLQLEEMKKGNFTDAEIQSAKLDIADSFKGISDYGEALSEYYSFLDIAGLCESPEQVVEKTNRVTRAEIIAAANSVQTDTVYFLKGEE